MRYRTPTLLVSVLLLLALSCGGGTSVPTPSSEAPAPEPAASEPIPEPGMMKQTRTVKLFFAHPTKSKLAVEKRKVFEMPDNTAMLKQVLSTLERGPLTNLKPTIPANLSVRNVFTVEDVIYIDLKREINPARIGGVEGESLMIHSLVNTALAVFPDKYHGVRFLVDGEESESLLGHFDAHRVFRYNGDIVSR